MSGSTTAIERLLEVSNALWDAMYESGEVPTHAERSYYYLALKDAMTENAKLCALLIDAFVEFVRSYGDADAVHEYSNRMRELGVEVE